MGPRSQATRQSDESGPTTVVSAGRRSAQAVVADRVRVYPGLIARWWRLPPFQNQAKLRLAPVCGAMAATGDFETLSSGGSGSACPCKGTCESDGSHA